MKTAYKLSGYLDGNTENTIGYYETLEEAQKELPKDYTHYGTLKLEDNRPHFQITKFTYPDLIADMPIAWDNREVIQVLFYYN
ncbi:hypothetical protein [Adhaeribacter aquaticus]|uniref:hypothetical protein n=1 Tax=Adhaeribacter aquaticus TaxID=299567 RepID=UPI00041E1D96|nr:hypothetical protein [Adhaeribacter aquaticus]